MRQGGEDSNCWIPSKRRKFEIRSFSSIVYSGWFTMKSIWRVKALLRVVLLSMLKSGGCLMSFRVCQVSFWLIN
jgi:hypothetical protein